MNLTQAASWWFMYHSATGAALSRAESTASKRRLRSQNHPVWLEWFQTVLCKKKNVFWGTDGTAWDDDDDENTKGQSSSSAYFAKIDDWMMGYHGIYHPYPNFTYLRPTFAEIPHPFFRGLLRHKMQQLLPGGWALVAAHHGKVDMVDIAPLNLAGCGNINM